MERSGIGHRLCQPHPDHRADSNQRSHNQRLGPSIRCKSRARGRPLNDQTFTIDSVASTYKTVSVDANDIVWDATHQQIYASLASGNGSTGNSVVAIDPFNATMGTPKPAGSGPNLLALSSDASYLWVGEDGSGAVQRYTLPNLTPDIKISLPTALIAGVATTQHAISQKAAPGSLDTIAVLLGDPASSLQSNGLIVYDNATQRPTIPGGTADNIESIDWGPNASTLYGDQGYYGTGGFSIINVNASGASLGTTYPHVFSAPANEQIHFDQASGYVYSDYGRVTNPSTGDIVGTFNLSALYTELNHSATCLIDSNQGIVFFLGQTFSQWAGSSGYTILAFDKTTYKLLNSLTIPQYSGQQTGLIRWGNAGLVFNTVPTTLFTGTNSIYLIDGSFVNGTLPPDFSDGTQVAPLPNLVAVNPQMAVAGSGDTTITVSGANFQPGAVVYLTGASALNTFSVGGMLNTVYINSGQLQATIPAKDLNAVGTAVVTVSNGALTSQALNELAFTVVPAGSGLTALNLNSLDVAWDPISALLYASVWSPDPQFPNSIVAIDPTAGQVVKSQFVGADPDLVRTSSDGKYLYTGFMLENAAVQLALPGLNSPLQWSLGASSLVGPLMAIDIQPAPGGSQTTAISTGVSYAINNMVWPFSPEEDGSLAIFDNNLARPASLPGPPTGANIYGSLQWGPNGSTLYAADNENTLSLYELAVGSSGVSVQEQCPYCLANSNLIADPYYNLFRSIHFDAGRGLIYDDNGVVIDPVRGNQIVTLNSFGLAAPDSSLNRIFILGQTPSQMAATGLNNYTIASFDQTLYTPVNSITLTGIVGIPVAMVRWGSSGLAIVTYNNPSTAEPGPRGMLYVVNDSTFVSAMSRPAGAPEFEPLKLRWTRSNLPSLSRRIQAGTVSAH
jgi:hypothetical protein